MVVVGMVSLVYGWCFKCVGISDFFAGVFLFLLGYVVL